MKRFTKRITLFLVLLIGSTFIFVDSSTANAETTDIYDYEIETNVFQNSDETVSTYADTIGWRYKTVNGKLYRRKYNYTKEVWIGDWELVS